MEEEKNMQELNLTEQINLQTQRLGVIASSLESARLNQGVTNKFIEWTEDELTKVMIHLSAASIRAKIIQDKLEHGEEV